MGVATGLVPGLHVNTLAALVLALAPGLGPWGAVALVAVATVHAFVGILPATYLGAAGEENALSVLPAHRMLRDGQGPDAVRASLGAGLAALLCALALALPYKWLLGEPGRLLGRLDGAAPWVLGGVLVLLVAQEARRGLRRAAWAATVLAASGLLGLVTLRLPLAGFLPVPASPLLPLLSGVFGAAGLVASLHAASPVPTQSPPQPWGRRLRRRVRLGTALGVAAAGATAAMPGLTSAVATAIARSGVQDDDPRPVLATLSAVNTAHAGFSLLMLWTVLRERTGLASAVRVLEPVEPWTRGAPPPALAEAWMAMVGAAILGLLAALALDRPFARGAANLSPRLLNGGALVLLTVVVAILSGPLGLLAFGAATLLGLVPLAAGVRRVNLTGCLLVPALALRLGWVT